MTLPTTTSAVTYAGNGVTTQFDWTFLIPSGALEVYRTENDIAVLVEASAYSASGLDDSNGGTVTFAAAPALGQTITIKRNVALTQDVALVTGSAFYAEVVEGAFDRATMQIQQLAEEMGRAVQVPIGSGLDPADYLDAAARSAAAAASSASSAAGSATASGEARSGSETARDEAVAAKNAVDAALASIGPATETVAGISRQATVAEATSGTSTTPEAKPHVTPEGLAAARWNSRAIGERFAIQTHLVGAETPPNVEGGPRFIKLTAGDAYNAGLLSGETVTGTAPLITATAVIALESSPLFGQTVHLLNTEGRFSRAGVSGVLEDDAFQGHKHRTALGAAKGTSAETVDGSEAAISNTYTSASIGSYYRAYTGPANVSDGSHGEPRTANETRPRNMAETNYMRIF